MQGSSQHATCPEYLRGAAAIEAVAQAPEYMVAEVLDGVLHLSPRPRLRCLRAASVLGGKIGDAFDWGTRSQGWYILDEPELHIGEGPDIVVPDICGWRRERLPAIPDEPACELPPDWACEVLSPSTESIDRGKKRVIYAREGVAYLWFVDPAARRLEVYARSGEGYREIGCWAGDVRVEAPPFTSLTLSLAQLWVDAS